MNKYGPNFLIAIQVCSIVLLTLFAAAAATAQTSDSAPAAAHAGNITPPPVPDTIKVEEPHKVFLVGHATGTQNYVCLPCDPSTPNCPLGVAYKLFTPQATLFNDRGRQITTHFFSPNPFENGLVRAAWQHSQDTSAVWGQVTGSSSDPNFVTPGAIPWLRIQIVGALAGPTGGDKLTKTTFVQRVNTVGGAAPSTACSLSADIGNQAFVPYTADYFFYKDAGRHSRDDY